MLLSALGGALSQEIVKKLNAAINEHSQYAIQFPDQFEKLVKQLDYMRAFVSDAEKQKKNAATVKALSISLQKLIYGADDLVTDCEIRAYYQKMNEPCCNVISFSEMAFRYHTGKKLTQINKEIASMHEDLKTFGTIGNRSDDGEGFRQKQPPRSNENLDEKEIVGLTEDVGEIRKWILEQDESEPLLRIGIVGMGGLGKTTLAKMIMRDKYLSNRFQRKIWISISQTVDEDNILKSMLEGIESGGVRDSSTGSIMTKIKYSLTQGTYLIVFDDVWRGGDSWWEHVSDVLPKTKGHSNCVIITSRIIEEVKRMGVKDARIHHKKILTKSESWELFERVVSSRRDETMIIDDQLVGIGEKIVEKCNGLPLAIKTIGGLMSIIEPTFINWERIKKDFHSKLKTAEKEDKSNDSPSVIASLRLSYDELSPQLKQCLLSLSIYPEDHEIDTEQLVHWWHGEGFVPRGNETITESASDCLSQLISRCLVEVFRQKKFDGSITGCKMHDMIREMAIGIAKEEDFSSFDNYGTNIANESTRRLGVTKDTTFQPLKGNINLRALLLISTQYIAFNNKIQLANVKSLRVLDLGKVSLDKERTSMKDFWAWITSQKRLAYLNLRDVDNLTLVPVSIGKLWGLQVLFLGECKNLRNLPKSITNLPKLTILDVGNCPCLEFLPKGIHRLSNLQELYGFKIPGKENPQGCRFVELKSLTQLMVLQFDVLEESIIDDHELIILKELTNLKVLSVNASNCEGEILSRLDKLILPETIQELYLKNYFGDTTPTWINPKSLPNLQYLCIEDSRVKTVSPIFWGDKEVPWNVKGLCLKFCRTLKLKLQELEQLMPNLRHKQISQCDSLEGFSNDIKSPVSLPERQEKSDDFLPPHTKECLV